MNEFKGIGLDVSELTLEGVLVGHRLLVTYLGSINKIFSRVDLRLTSDFESFLVDAHGMGIEVRRAGNQIEGKPDKEQCMIYFGNDSYFIELDKSVELVPILKVAHLASERLKPILKDFEIIIRKDLLFFLYSRGVELSDKSDEVFDANNLCYSCRFLGGTDAWSGYNDICEEGTLNKKVLNALIICLDDFNEKYKVTAYYSMGEKGWIYIYVR